MTENETSQYSPLYACSMSFVESVLSMLSKPRLVFDIGSNDGGLAAWFSARSEGVVAFEPIQSVMDKAIQSYGEDPKIEWVKNGLSDHDHSELVGIYNCWTLTGSPAVPTDRTIEFPFDFSQEVHFITLDDAVELYGVPDFIKLDVDGYEELVIDGGSRFFASHLPPIMVELSALAKIIGMRPEGALVKLYAMGYKAHSMDGSYCAETFLDAMKCFPWNSSYDVMMIHSDFKYD